MRDRLFVLWIALLGATRVDLLLGEGPFVLTPFLLLSPLLLLLEGWRLVREQSRPVLPPGLAGWTLALGALAVLLILSAVFALDPGWSGRRVGLLLVQLFFVTLLGTSLLHGPGGRRLLARGAWLGVGLALLASLGQLLAWGLEAVPSALFGGALSLETYGYEGVLPRLSGLGYDPNLGAMTLLFHLALLAGFAAPSAARTVVMGAGALVVFGSLSRSAVLAAGVLVLASLLRPLQLRVTPLLAGALAGCAAAALVVVLAVPGVTEPVVDAGWVLTERLSPSEGSGSDHLHLLGRGWETATDDLSTMALGIGYGNAFLVLQDVFPGNDYGNFHSLYLTFFAEVGIVALLLLLLVLGVALARGAGWRPLIGALLVYNLFQQAHTEPWFWLVLLAAWTRVPVRPAPPPDARPGAPAASAPPSTPARVLALGLALVVGGCDEVLTEPFTYGEVEVEAVRRSGDPVPGVALTLYSGTRHLGFGATGSDGRARFERVPAGPMGVYAEADSLQYRPLDGAAGFVRTLRMEEGGREVVTFTYLRIGPGSLRVEVLDPEGRGLEGIPVEVYSPQGVVEARSTPASGVFTLEGLPFGSYGVRATRIRGLERPGDVAALDGFLVEDRVTEVATFRFQPCRGSVSARVRTPGNAPLEGISLFLYEPDAVGDPEETGADGRVIWPDLPCATYGVRMTLPPGLRALEPAEGFVDGIGLRNQENREISFTVEVCRATLRALVQDEAGAPVEGARIELYRSTGVVETRFSGPDGEALVEEIACGEGFGVRVVPPPGLRLRGLGPGDAYFDGISLTTPGEVRTFTFVLLRE